MLALIITPKMSDPQKQPPPTPTTYDVVIIGAGISGINTAYRLQTQLPSCNYTIIEARGALGGTWDLFRYPGIRSDSDLHTFCFPFRPWPEKKAIADGPSITKYINETAALYGIDKRVQFHKKFVGADWSSKSELWTLTLDARGEKETLQARFVIIGTGYYDYHNPLPAVIPGLGNFKGQVVHPQFWPGNLDYTDKKVVVIGSGATAVTLIPSLAQKAAHVTMLQRSPSYVLHRPTTDLIERFAQRFLPTWLGRKLMRWKNVLVPFLLFRVCRAFPEFAKSLLKAATTKELPPDIPHDPHFKPEYNPWEQRMCICPDGDFFAALRAGKTHVATGKIRTMTDNRIILESGEEIEADIIITATGLKMHLAGGAIVTVDGEVLVPGEKFIWHTAMLQDLPNAAFIIGYTNASWTLGADATALLICKVMNYMRRKNLSVAVPRVNDPMKLKVLPLMDLKSTYIQAATTILPKAGDKGPWKPRSNYFSDMYNVWFGNFREGLEFSKASASK